MFTAKDALYQAMAYTDKKVKGGGGGIIPVPLTITENGTYTAQVGQAYNPVTVNVPTYDNNSLLYITAVYPEDYNYDIVLTKDTVSSEDVYNLALILSSAYNLTIASRHIENSAFDDKEITNNLIFTDSIDAVVGFSQCTIFGDVIFNSGVTVIGENAFYSSNLGNTSLVLPEGVTTIMDGAFSLCTLGYNSESEYHDYDGTIILPSTLESIGSSAFQISSYLNTVNLIIHAVTPPSLYSSDSISLPEGGKIYVPAESVDAYKSAEHWSELADIIEAIPTES